ncbi:MAG TPA: flagellar protein FliS [Firmicutes bacterium]|nr:flagellar protein FliS [Bacillota bacterium]
MVNLDVGEIAHNLQRLYGYVNDLLIQANVKKDPTKAADALKMLQELRDTWESVVSQTK